MNRALTSNQERWTAAPWNRRLQPAKRKPPKAKGPQVLPPLPAVQNTGVVSRIPFRL